MSKREGEDHRFNGHGQFCFSKVLTLVQLKKNAGLTGVKLTSNA